MCSLSKYIATGTLLLSRIEFFVQQFLNYKYSNRFKFLAVLALDIGVGFRGVKFLLVNNTSGSILMKNLLRFCLINK